MRPSLIWQMNGVHALNIGGLVGAGTGWGVNQTMDYNGDGKGDILWQRLDGSTVIWQMNGLNSTGSGGLVGAGTGWNPTPSGVP